MIVRGRTETAGARRRRTAPPRSGLASSRSTSVRPSSAREPRSGNVLPETMPPQSRAVPWLVRTKADRRRRRRHRRERARAGAPLLELLSREAAGRGLSHPDRWGGMCWTMDDEPISIPERQRPEEDRVDDAEDGRRRADAEPEGQDQRPARSAANAEASVRRSESPTGDPRASGATRAQAASGSAARCRPA